MLRKAINDDSVTFNEPVKTPSVYAATFFAAIGGFLCGYDTCVISGAILHLKNQFELSQLQQELLVSVTIFGAWISCLIGGYCTDKFGRKSVIAFASFTFIAGPLVMGLSTTMTELMCGRLIVGIGCGLASMTVPMYIAEVAPAHIRGRLVTINNCSITFGQLAASIIDGIFAKDEISGWRYMLGLAAVPSVIQFFGFLFMPESPRWLVANKKYEQALNVLKNTRNANANVEEEFNSIKDSCLEIERQQEEKRSKFIIIEVLKTPHLRRALIVGCSLQIIQQLAGINTVMYYSATIIQMSGVKDIQTIMWLSCATAGVNSFFSLAAFLFVERLGRRILTLVSLGGVILSLSFLAVSFQLASVYSPSIAANTSVDLQCSSFRSCDSCTLSSSCGYCFTETPQGTPTNGSCLLVNTTNTDRSLHGICSDDNFPNNLTYAFEWCPTSFFWMTFSGLLLYLLFFAPGLGSTPWTINSEIYPLWARSVCYSTATSFNWLFNFAVSVSFLSLTQALTKYGAFWLYACISLVGLIFLILMLPETRGKSLEEVEGLFIHPYYKEMSSANEKKVVQLENGLDSKHGVTRCHSENVLENSYEMSNNDTQEYQRV